VTVNTATLVPPTSPSGAVIVGVEIENTGSSSLGSTIVNLVSAPSLASSRFWARSLIPGLVGSLSLFVIVRSPAETAPAGG
jgi:hypothetical protein